MGPTPVGIKHNLASNVRAVVLGRAPLPLQIGVCLGSLGASLLSIHCSGGKDKEGKGSRVHGNLLVERHPSLRISEGISGESGVLEMRFI